MLIEKMISACYYHRNEEERRNVLVSRSERRYENATAVNYIAEKQQLHVSYFEKVLVFAIFVVLRDAKPKNATL